MNNEVITLIVSLAITTLSTIGLLIAFILAIKNGELKQFILEKMEEAEKLGMPGKEKLQYVVDSVKEKYKLLSIVVNVKKIVETLIDFSKKVNSK